MPLSLDTIDAPTSLGRVWRFFELCTRMYHHFSCYISRYSRQLKAWTASLEWINRDYAVEFPTQIEDYPPGYPQMSALLGSHAAFRVYRRFSTIRARLLLAKQDRLVELENRLERIDREEQGLVALGSIRRDHNDSRKLVLKDLDDALVEYDGFISRAHTMESYPKADQKNIASVQNWLEYTACVARPEREYLSSRHDLASVGAECDTYLGHFEGRLEASMVDWFANFRKRPNFSISRDPNVHIYSGTLFKKLAHLIFACLIVFLLFAPVALLTYTNNTLLRILVVSISAAIFILSLCALTRAKPSEMFIAGTTYAAVVIVFVSGNDGNP